MYLYRIAAVVALCAAAGFGIACVLAAAQSRLSEMQLYAGVAMASGWFGWFAKKQGKALQGEQSQVSRLTAEQYFETFRQSPEAISGLGIKWSAGAYLISTALSVALALSAVTLAHKDFWVFAGICGLLAVIVVRSLGAMLRQPEWLHIGPEGLNDRSRFGLIPWAAIDNVSFLEKEIKGSRKAMLQVKVDSIAPYLGRLGLVQRRLWALDPAADIIPFPLQGHDVLPASVFQVVRHFHERALPAGAIAVEDNRYVVNRNGLMAEAPKQA